MPAGFDGVAVVARSCDDDDAVQPELLDRLVERVEAEADRVRADEREVRDADVVRRLVREDPVDRRDDVARQGLASARGDANVDEPRVPGHAGQRSRSSPPPRRRPSCRGRTDRPAHSARAS